MHLQHSQDSNLFDQGTPRGTAAFPIPTRRDGLGPVSSLVVDDRRTRHLLPSDEVNTSPANSKADSRDLPVKRSKRKSAKRRN